MKLNEITKEKGFECGHCLEWNPFSDFIGTKHRNHCPKCLWSKHVDFKKSGDRKASCKGLMKPIGLTFKEEGEDKYGKKRQGEIMIIHLCEKCNEISINRIAGDDNSDSILKLFKDSKNANKELLERLKNEGIMILTEKDKDNIMIQLFGK